MTQTGGAQGAPSNDLVNPEASRERARKLNSLFGATFDSVLRMEEYALDNRLTAGLTISELHTIAAVGVYDQRPMNAIASYLHVTLATVTAAVTKLEKKGFMVRRRNEADRRQVLVSLTSKGRKACRAHDMFHERMVARALDGLSDTEADALMDSLRHLVDFFTSECDYAEQLRTKKKAGA